MHKGDGIAVLQRVEVDVGDAFHFLRQLGELEVVGGEQGQRLDFVGQIFRTGPRQR